ncbi:MAG TPA: hypothetical protein IGS53_10300 [Leptolyngbyaceae cyanobacterium M33_DOE_097]|nr:hypothetical protein [Leptolyngbyaceae cyanobacterium M33_DOE_097]
MQNTVNPESLCQLGAEVVQGDLTDLDSMHQEIAGIACIYFGMPVMAEGC